MNVYDFDNTILHGDSTARFYAYCMLHRPKMWLDIPGQAVNGLMYALRLREKQVFKQRMLHFLTLIGDVDATVEAFWQKNFSRVKPWYYEAQREDDVVISASPEFLVKPACDRLGIKCTMGSPVDKHTGKFFGPNCHGKEKVRRFREVYPNAQIEEFYSDSYSDSPLAGLAQKAWLVKGTELKKWGEK